jgi:hypothetical protein
MGDSLSLMLSECLASHKNFMISTFKSSMTSMYDVRGFNTRVPTTTKCECALRTVGGTLVNTYINNHLASSLTQMRMALANQLHLNIFFKKNYYLGEVKG